MNPEEARARLVQLLDAQAEMRKQQPMVYYVEIDEHVRGGVRRFVQIFAVNDDLEITSLDYWIRVAGGHVVPTNRNRVQQPGEYTPERGWRVDGSMQPTTADVYDLLMGALAPNGHSEDVAFVRNIVIRALY